VAGNPLPPGFTSSPRPTPAPTVSPKPTVDLATIACEVDLSIQCSGHDSSTCYNPVPDAIQCNGGSVSEISFRYTGDGCSAGTNTQNDQHSCVGEANLPASVRIEATPAEQGTSTLNSVQVGDVLTIAGSEEFKEMDIEIFLVNTNILVQKMKINTECSVGKPLQLFSLSDQFGGLKVVGFSNQGQGEISGERYTLTYNINVINSGSGIADILALKITLDGVDENIPSSALPNGGEVTTGGTFIITRQSLDVPFELQTTHEIIAEVSAENKKGSPCTASDSYTVSPSL